MKAPESYTISDRTDLEARCRGFRRIIALSPDQQRLIDPALVEEARLWLLDSETSVYFC